MVIPFSPEDVFETHKDYEVISFEDEILVVDNWYKNFSRIKELLLNTPVPKWKASKESRNFVDYFDCRLILPIHVQSEKTDANMGPYVELAREYYGVKSLRLMNHLYEFNYYKNVRTNVSSDLQHYPHVDHQINCLVYMDDVCSGGTAVYETSEAIPNKEEDNLLFNISKLNKKVIQAKPNRMVMFRGTKYHGGYIEDHNKYVKDWRINQIMFFENA
jgi:hypothetical protein